MIKIINKYYEPELKQVRVVLLEEELNKLKEEIERLKKQSNDYAKRIIKAIEYIEENCTERGEGKWAYRTINADNTLNILNGVDKE